MKSDRYLAARLLSKKEGLSVLEKEEILGNILQGQDKEDRETAHRGVIFGRRLAGLAIASVALLVPILLFYTPGSLDDEFVPRGGSAQTLYTVSCLGPDGRTSCHQGDKLIFEVAALAPKRHFAAFSKTQDGTIIWYFPGDEHKKSVRLDQAERDRILATGILLGPEHRPGNYEVHGLFSDQPLGRSAIRAIFENDKKNRDPSYLVVKTKFQVRAP